MHAHVETRHPAIAEVCRRFESVRLEVFGSASAGDFDPQRTDVDALMRFGVAGVAGAADAMAEYFGLKTQLVDVLSRPVDLLVDGAVSNRYVLQASTQPDNLSMQRNPRGTSFDLNLKLSVPFLLAFP